MEVNDRSSGVNTCMAPPARSLQFQCDFTSTAYIIGGPRNIKDY